MSTPHINANFGDFGKVVLMPGDPIRAKWIAETFLHDYKEVTNVRGILGFTGLTKNGKRISVMASGMGQPSIGIYSYELYTSFGVEAIIRVGTCGSYQSNINLRDVLICSTASTDSNWLSQYHLNGTFSAAADFDLMFSAVEECKKLNLNSHIGNILSSDIFYDTDTEAWKKWADLGVMGVEMESFALYCNAAKLHKKALCLLTVSDSIVKKANLSSEERAKGLYDMVSLGVAVAEKFA